MDATTSAAEPAGPPDAVADVSLSLLALDPDTLGTCVGCGLCLPHCPTYRVTGEEKYSPRGRIDAMRAVDSGALDIDDEFVDFMETCVQCRGCETACPSGVEFGTLMEGTRATLASEHRITPWWQRWGYATLARHRLLLIGSSVLAVAQRLGLVPRRLGLPRLPLRRKPAVVGTGSDVWLFTGCVMDAWQRRTHRATAELIALAGSTFAIPGRGGGCCGALHVHAGLHDDAATLAGRMIASMPGEAPIVVNSAGCGAAMKDYGELLATADARQFSERVVDVNEWLADRIDDLPASTAPRPTVIVQDPCHLRHVQRIQEPVRRALTHVADVVELDDDGLCCGAGGAYSALQPELASAVRDRKVSAIERARNRSGATIVASANPGCSMHLDAVLGRRDDLAGLTVRHPVEIIADTIRQ